MSKLVQAILVEKTDDISHEAAVRVAATASLNTAFLDMDDEFRDPVWEEWLSGPFTKTVRRVKPAIMERLIAADGPEFAQAMIVDIPGLPRSMSLRPMTMDQFPKLVRNAQVSGFDVPKEFTTLDSIDVVQINFDAGKVAIVVNDELGMTTGKECAQVSHGFWIAWLNGVRDERKGYYPAVMRVSQKDFSQLEETARYCVNDNGLTEFDGVVTKTVLVM